jgi:hypothetical protein
MTDPDLIATCSARGYRDPVFATLDRQIAAGLGDRRRIGGPKRVPRRDSEIAQARGIEPWMLRRERYLLAAGRIEQLNREEAG